MPKIPPPKKPAAEKRNAPAAGIRNAPIGSIPNPDAAEGFTYVGKCARCGRQFLMKNSLHLYCGRACKRAVENELRRRKKTSQRDIAGPKYCEHEPCPNRIIGRRKGAKYCSNKCRQAAHREWVWLQTPIP